MPKWLEYQSSENFSCILDNSRKHCTLGRSFDSVVSSSILKLSTIKTNLKDISCLCVLGNDIIVTGGRFSPYLEFFRASDK